jgi:hypothetical protein
MGRFSPSLQFAPDSREMPFKLAIDDQGCDVQTYASEAVVGYSVHF